MFLLKSINYLRYFTRNISSTNLKGQVITTPLAMTSDDIKSILWTAIELRQISHEKPLKIQQIKDAKVTLVLKKPSIYMEVPTKQASEIFSVNLHVINDPLWDYKGALSDTLQFLQLNSSLILVETGKQTLLERVKDLKVALFNMQSLTFKLTQCLSDFMTIQLRYQRLKGLRIAWLGPPNSTLNTYLCLAPKLGVDISFCCACRKNSFQSPAFYDTAKQESSLTHTCVEEFAEMPLAVKNADVVAISKHLKKDDRWNLSLDILKDARPDCSVLCEYPRVSNIESTMTTGKQCLVWESVCNTKWILAAVILKLLFNYDHQIDMPKFG